MHAGNKILTVFTPTYNRAYILPKLYQALRAQTDKNFDWLVVDDGSVDDTESLVNGWIAENEISIRYIKQENGGKMKAHNRGVEETETELFVCVDSDDWIVSDSVESIVNAWRETINQPHEGICGLVAYRGRDERQPLGNEFPLNVETSTLSGLYAVGFQGDTTLVFKTEVLRAYPFPIIGKEKFITEAYVYEQIDRAYRLRLLPKVITVCEYREDGLTNNLEGIVFRNPCGYVAYALQQAKFAKTLKGKIAAYIRANCFRHATKGVEMPVQPKSKFLYTLTYPLGRLLYWRKKRAYKKEQKARS